MPPERHDDVEDVVGRAWGDVPPEETHELSLLRASVEINAAGQVDSDHIVYVFVATTTTNREEPKSHST